MATNSKRDLKSMLGGGEANKPQIEIGEGFTFSTQQPARPITAPVAAAEQREKTTVRLYVDVVRRLKVYCVNRNVTMLDFLTDLITKTLDEADKS